MSFPKYPEYKDSGVEWLGEVPKHWTCTSLKKGYVVTLGKMLQPERKANSDVLKPYIRAANIQWAGIDVSDVKEMWFSPAEIESLSLELGDLLVSEGGDVGRSALWRHDIVDCYFQNSVNRIRPFGENSTEYLYYWMSALKDKGFIDVVCNKSTIAHFTAEKVQAVPVLFPPPEEQSAIAAFLDRETAKIDALVAEQEKLIGLLREKRQAVISHAVTKGLDPNVPMKDSGDEWLGEVPEHWAVVRLRHFADVLRGKFTHRPRNDPAYYDGDYPFIQTGDITAAQRFITSYKQTLNELGASVSKEFPKGTLVMAIAANIGDVAILDFPAFFPDSIVGLAPHEEVDLFFLYRLMQAMKSPMLMTATISTQMNLNVEQIVSLSAPRPPLVEQKAIVEHIDAECSVLEKMTFEAQNTIHLLKERRSALISAAVTGKIDVRGLVESTPDNALEKP